MQLQMPSSALPSSWVIMDASTPAMLPAAILCTICMPRLPLGYSNIESCSACTAAMKNTPIWQIVTTSVNLNAGAAEQSIFLCAFAGSFPLVLLFHNRLPGSRH